MFYNDNIENGMVLDNDREPRLSQYDIDFENQDDDRDNQWFEEYIRSLEEWLMNRLNKA